VEIIQGCIIGAVFLYENISQNFFLPVFYNCYICCGCQILQISGGFQTYSKFKSKDAGKNSFGTGSVKANGGFIEEVYSKESF